MFLENPKPVKFATCKIADDDTPVVPHLAYDLSDLDELRRQGRPINQQNVESMYYDGEVQSRCSVPLERSRGVDINDVWNAQMSGKKRASQAGVRQVDLSNFKTN